MAAAEAFPSRRHRPRATEQTKRHGVKVVRPVGRSTLPRGICPRDWDANWLNIHGDVTQADGKSWTFEDPCLTTWEAQALGNWLRGAAAGTVPVSPFGTGEPEGQLLVFTEPNLAFSVESRISDQVGVRVHFSLEAVPPWLDGDQRQDIFDYVVLIRLSTAELADAADSWTRDLTRYPER